MTKPGEDTAFDPETITLLAGIVDRVWNALSPERQAETTRANLAEYILTLATHGERNAVRLYESVLAHFTKP